VQTWTAAKATVNKTFGDVMQLDDVVSPLFKTGGGFSEAEGWPAVASGGTRNFGER
jgi:hypothetical protein